MRYVFFLEGRGGEGGGGGGPEDGDADADGESLLGLGFDYEKWEEALGCSSFRKGVLRGEVWFVS